MNITSNHKKVKTKPRKLKKSEGPDLKVLGSSELIQLLLKNDLVDEMWLVIYPVILVRKKNCLTIVPPQGHSHWLKVSLHRVEFSMAITSEREM